MTTGYQVDVKLLREGSYDVVVEHVAHSPLALHVVDRLVLFRVGPEKVAEQTRVGNIRRPLYHLNVPEIVELLAQSAMHAENLVVDQGGNRELLEHVHELLKEPAILLARAG